MNWKTLPLEIASLPLRMLIVVYIHARWAVKRQFGLKARHDVRLSEGPLDVDHVELPEDLRKRYKQLFFRRGLKYDNCLHSKEMTEVIDAMLAHVEKHYDPSSIGIKPIETVDFAEMSDPERFYERYVKNIRPIVIKNFPLNKEKWSLEYFGRVFEHYPVLVTNLTTQEHREQELGEFLKSDENTYIHTNESLWYGDPTLEASLPFKSFGSILKRNLMTAHLFVGKKRTSITPFHCANNYNIFFQLKGRKRWTFVNPEYTYMMYPMTSRFRAYYAAGVPSVEGCDTERFPLFKYCPKYRADLEEGDLLINPPLWWHSVQALTDETLSVASRWGSMGQATLFGTDTLQDAFDTNHLFTSISSLSPFQVLMSLGECSKLLHINHGKIELSRKIRGNTTLYETGSHDDMPSKGLKGELDASWVHKSWKPRFVGQAWLNTDAAPVEHPQPEPVGAGKNG